MINVKLKCRICGEGELECDVDPGVAPKPCWNPDDPAYSDPGSAGDVEWIDFACGNCGHEPDEEDEAQAFEKASSHDPFDDYQGPDDDSPWC